MRRAARPQALTAKQEQEHVLKEELRHAVARHDRLAARAAELEAQLREAQHRRPSPAQQVLAGLVLSRCRAVLRDL